MKVRLIAHTPEPDMFCSIAAQTCVSESIPDATTTRALKGALASGHESIAEHASFTFAISGVSRACSHQLVRHRMASYSQQSQRYVNMDRFEYVIPESIENHPDALEHYAWAMKAIRKTYDTLTNHGIPEEDARYILPNACCTNLVVTMNARELRHFFALRCCNRAQWEIRELANAMLDLVKPVAPLLFADAGPSCVKLGYCPEGKKGCGKK